MTINGPAVRHSSSLQAAPRRRGHAQTSRPQNGEFVMLDRPAVFDINPNTGSLKESVQKGAPDDCRAAHLRETDCVAGVGGLELRNVVANYPCERSHRFAGIQSNSGFGDYSRLSCGVGDTKLGLGSAGIFSEHSARKLAIMQRRREGTNWPRSLSLGSFSWPSTRQPQMDS
jgi:hypothetical protein